MVSFIGGGNRSTWRKPLSWLYDFALLLWRKGP